MFCTKPPSTFKRWWIVYKLLMTLCMDGWNLWKEPRLLSNMILPKKSFSSDDSSKKSSLSDRKPTLFALAIALSKKQKKVNVLDVQRRVIHFTIIHNFHLWLIQILPHLKNHHGNSPALWWALLQTLLSKMNMPCLEMREQPKGTYFLWS